MVLVTSGYIHGERPEYEGISTLVIGCEKRNREGPKRKLNGIFTHGCLLYINSKYTKFVIYYTLVYVYKTFNEKIDYKSPQ